MKSILTALITMGLFVGCVTKEPLPVIVERQATVIEKVKPIIKKKKKKKKHHVVKQKKLPKAPKKKIKLKKVEDKNYSDKYMYPEDTKSAKKDAKLKKKSVIKTSSSMSKSECISMISQEKFDKYTAMFGSEAASIKRCTMLKAMRK
jgi:LAS superfamily LD-carboxypeptidase LdcB